MIGSTSIKKFQDNFTETSHHGAVEGSAVFVVCL